MKRILSLNIAVTALAVAACLASCERDVYYDQPRGDDYYEDPYEPSGGHDDGYLADMAATLRGQWKGSITTDFYDPDGMHRHQTYSAEFHFDQYQSNTINGRGLEIDYEENGKEVYRCAFSWYIDGRTEDIYLKFDDERLMVVTAFHLDDTSFYGTMQSDDGQETDSFSLSRYTYSNAGRVFDTE